MRVICFLFFLLAAVVIRAQSPTLSGKRFVMTENIPGETLLIFDTNGNAAYVMKGNGYEDKCPCSCSVKGKETFIKCICQDKDIYPDPIEDSFIYNSAANTLTSTRYRTSPSGSFIVWMPR